MKYPFRYHHILQLLNDYESSQLPIDLTISRYFQANRALGSKDKKEVAETIYTLLRWILLIDYLSGAKTYEERLNFLPSFDPLSYQERSDIPLHIRCAFPETLFKRIAASHGEDKAYAICLASNTIAPTTVRTNTLKITRDALLKKFQEAGFSVCATQHSDEGITFLEKIHFYSTEEFKSGLFEIQDEASQLVALKVEAKPGEHVLDYCAGSAGKALAFSPRMNGMGQVYIHDIRPWILDEAKKRLKRAGIQNYQLLPPDSTQKKKLKKKMDWVLVDAPCSGTGTLRRNPDLKLKDTDAMIARLIGQQRTIFEQALSYLKPGGKIVYSTCSLLNEENQQQVQHFIQTYGLKLVEEPFVTLPEKGNMDGFFAAVFQSSEK